MAHTTHAWRRRRPRCPVIGVHMSRAARPLRLPHSAMYTASASTTTPGGQTHPRKDKIRPRTKKGASAGPPRPCLCPPVVAFESDSLRKYRPSVIRNLPSADFPGTKLNFTSSPFHDASSLIPAGRGCRAASEVFGWGNLLWKPKNPHRPAGRVPTRASCTHRCMHAHARSSRILVIRRERQRERRRERRDGTNARTTIACSCAVLHCLALYSVYPALACAASCTDL